jgi:hypothetical protein
MPVDYVTLIIGLIGGSGLVGLLSRIYKGGEKSGITKTKIEDIQKNIKSQDERITYIERMFMNNAPGIAKDVRKRIKSQKEE